MKTFITIAILLSTKSNAQIATRRRGSAKPTIVRNRILRGNPQQQQQRRVEKTSSAKAEKAASAKSAKMYKNTKSAKASYAIQESPTALIAVSRYDENGKLITEYFDSPPEGYQLYLDSNLEAMSTPLQDMMSMSMIGALVDEEATEEEEEGDNASSIQAPVAPSASTSVKSSSLCIVGAILTGIFMQL